MLFDSGELAPESRVIEARIVAPFQGCADGFPCFPRALPWALKFGPFGAFPGCHSLALFRVIPGFPWLNLPVSLSGESQP
jgi:hypothetical protein